MSKGIAIGAVCVVLIGAASTVYVAGDRRPTGIVAPGTAKMAERLAELARRVSVRSPIENGRRIAELRSRLERAPDWSDQLPLRVGLGTELLHAGQSETAIDVLKQLRAEIRQRGGLESVDRRVSELLALSYLRLGEQQNCLLNHNAQSCLLPLSGGAVYQSTDAPRAAIAEYTQLLEGDPENLAYRWLLNLAYMTIGEHPRAVPSQWLISKELFASEGTVRPFLDVAPSVGINVVARAGGVVLEDFDADTDLDLMVSSWGLGEQLRYFVNEGGRFSERTTEAGLTGETGGLNLVHADYDNDGDADVLVLRGAWLGLAGEGNHPSSLLRNDGDGTFADVTEEAGLLWFRPTQTAGFADYDGDGWLDLFVGVESVGAPPALSELFHNNGDGTFSSVPREHAPAVTGFVKGVTWGDYNNDGRPDLYVSRFGQPNLLFRNDGPRSAPVNTAAPRGRVPSWSFTDVTQEAGVAEPLNSFATWFWDFDNDGWQDLFVAPFLGFGGRNLDTIVAAYLGIDVGGETARVYRNTGRGRFEDATRALGMDRPLVVMGSNFGDFDSDGYPDVYLGTGEPDLVTLVPNRMFRNDGARRFLDVTTAGGFGHLQKGHGISFADIDADGDLDIYAVMGGAYEGDVYQHALFRNPGTGNHQVTLVLDGVRSNRQALGARITVRATGPSGERVVHATAGASSSFGSTPFRQTIGLGPASEIIEVVVRWPSGTTQRFEGLDVDRVYSLREGEATAKRGYRTGPWRNLQARLAGLRLW